MIEQLIADSTAGQYLYASAPFRDEHLPAGEVDAAVAAVREQPDHTRYHVLMALRRDHPEAYESLSPQDRAKVLAGALGHLTFLNDFGYLSPGGSHDGESAVALVENGEAARDPLFPLLEDTSPAPSRGSEAATVARIHQLRRCDYAYRYLREIAGDPDPGFHPEVEVRDLQIAELLQRR